MNCGGYLPNHLQAAIQNGTVSETTLDTALARTWEASITLGNFDTPNEQCVLLYPALWLHTCHMRTHNPRRSITLLTVTQRNCFVI